ncbi:transcriptional regulator [Urechidicola croceus]|uniref:Transcriptional regulator n=1 Tax=Urechidicola croceus TaxID=1850246 RepID=A0A1D8PBY8_9FLAO|nr:transcriptional regulator [Urechidicola croceus]
MISKRSELTEKLGVHLECVDKLAPVAARIVAHLILVGQHGTTFDELVKNLSASKSTISTHLNSLQSINRITYFTKTGDRKKYFVVSPTGIIKSMDNMLEMWEQKKQMHIEIKEYKETYNNLLCNKTQSELEFDLEFHKDYLQYINEASASISKIKEKLIKNIKD